MASSHRLAKRQHRNMETILASLARIEAHLGISENDYPLEEDHSLAEMTISELRTLAEQNNTDLSTVSLKADIIRAITQEI